MAVDLAQLNADLAKIQDADLESVRNIVSDSLIIKPESDLADQAILQVLGAFRTNRNVFVSVVITGRLTSNFTLQVQTSLTPATGFILVRRWLFDWFNKRRD